MEELIMSWAYDLEKQIIILRHITKGREQILNCECIQFFDVENKVTLMSSRENTHYLFEILKSPDFRIIDGHIYYGNNIVKLRYDLIRRAEQYSLSTVAVLYKDVLKLE